MSKELFSVTALSLIGNIFRVAVSFAATVFAVRLLGAAPFGEISTVLAHAVLLHYLCTLGLDHTLSTIATGAALRRVVIVGVCGAIVVGSAITMLVVEYLESVVSAEPWVVRLLTAQMVFSGAAAIFSGYFRATHRFGALIFKDQILMPFGIFASSSIFLWLEGATTANYAVGYGLTSLCGFAFGLLAFLGNSGNQNQSSEFLGKDGVFVLKSLSVALMSGLEVMIPWGVVIAVSNILPAEQVGVLAILLRIGALCSFVGLAFAPIVSGVLPRLLKSSPSDGNRAIQIATFASLAWSLGLLAAALTFSSELSLLIGLERLPMAPLVLVFAGFVLDGGFGLLKFALIAADDGASNAWMMLFAVAIAVVAAFIGARFYGLIGGTAGCLLGYTALTAMRFARVGSRMRLAALSLGGVKELSVAGMPMVLIVVWSHVFEPALYARASWFVVASIFGLRFIWKRRRSELIAVGASYRDVIVPRA